MITETYKPDILVKFGDEDIDDIGNLYEVLDLQLQVEVQIY
jgi:hypothetical protein